MPRFSARFPDRNCWYDYHVDSLLDIRKLTVSFPVRDRDRVTNVAAVRDVSLAIGKGEVLGLVGESGSGKSVTSLAIMRLLPPTAAVEGMISFDGNELTTATDDDMRAL